jgi:hypothetical protein
MTYFETMEDDLLPLVMPCRHCPDGYVWGSDGPTAKTCPYCLGHARINADGSVFRPEQIKEVT